MYLSDRILYYKKIGIFLIGNPASYCPVFSELNNPSLYADFLPLATPSLRPVGLTPSTARQRLRVALHPLPLYTLSYRAKNVILT